MADFRKAIPFITAAEGGLSRSTADSASKHPAPWPYKGKSGWHTNKGITYSTFVAMAPKLGYQVTATNFFVMPEAIWAKIFKTGYWDLVKADKINSAPVALALVDYAFNFGPGGALRRISTWLASYYQIDAKGSAEIASAINNLTRKSDKEFFLAFIEHRKRAYKALKQPANEEGWLARMEELKETGLSLLTNNRASIAGLSFFFMCSGIGLFQ